VVVALALLGGEAVAQGYDLIALAPDSPVSGTLSAGDAVAAQGRVTVPLTLDLPALLAELDAEGAARGNLGSDEHRLSWLGPTSVLGVDPDGSVILRTRAHYEYWNDVLDIRVLEMSRDVDLRMRPVWDDAAKSLALDVEVLNIRDVPGEVEQWMRDLGVTLGGRLDLFDPDAAELGAIGLRLDPAGAEAIPGGLRLRFVASADLIETWSLLRTLDPGVAEAGVPGLLGRLLFGAPG